MSHTIILKDDFFQKLNSKEAYNVRNEDMVSFWNVLESQVKSEVIKRFGLAKLLDTLSLGSTESYKIGGNISTVHNADQGVFIDKAYEERYNRSFDRKNYEGKLDQITGKDTRLATQRKELMKNNTIIQDAYTHKQLPKDGRMHLDHIQSAKEIHDNKNARLFMNDNDRNNMAVDGKNLVPTDSSLNQSKGKKDLNKWENETKKNGETNGQYYGVDSNETENLNKEARNFINRTVNKHQVKEVTSASLKQGKEQAIRQVIGLAMYEFIPIFIDETQKYTKNWNEMPTFKVKLAEFKLAMESVKIRMEKALINIKSQFMGTITTGFVSGVVGALITGIINTVVTTGKQLSRLIQEGITNILAGFKLMVTNPNKLTKKELFKEVIKLIGTGLSVSIGILFSEALKQSLISMAIPAIVSDAMAMVGGILVTGVMSATVIYTVDNFGSILKKFNNGLNLIKFGCKYNTYEMREAFLSELAKIDEIYQELLWGMEKKYEELGRLADLAHDINLLASGQFKHSIQYARKMGVAEKEILHDLSEIDAYFSS